MCGAHIDAAYALYTNAQPQEYAKEQFCLLFSIWCFTDSDNVRTIS